MWETAGAKCVPLSLPDPAPARDQTGRHLRMSVRPLILTAALLIGTAVHADQLVFDTHVHYNEQDAQVFTPEQIIGLLREHHVERALVTSTPAQQAASLYRLDPERIVPFLGVYRNGYHKLNWYLDNSLPGYVEAQIEHGPWRGIGELHIFADQRGNPVLRQLVQMAAQHRLVLLMHADPAVIDTIYETAADLTVLWAHAGTFPYPDLLQDYLRRYPRLYIDLSVRNESIAPDGEIAEAWYNLFLQHPDRFVVGVDTYSTNRWRTYGAVLNNIRHWLAQLPADVRDRLAYENAERLFARPAED